MSLEKRNILELIGKARYNYHSCIITCYSFNFSFFESIVMPTLSVANIRNVNLMIDGNMLEQSLAQTIGQEFTSKSLQKTYSFTPVYEQGAFHPKIMMLFGKEQGLLIVGSGNMTSSGINSNDEIWGAFHLKGDNSSNQSIFGAAWNYLLPYLKKAKGFNEQKINWIKQTTPWLDNAIENADKSIKISNKSTVQFLGNTSSNSIFQGLKSKLPKNKTLKKLTIISPYFDSRGILLDELLQEFSPQKVNCLVDIHNGTLPYRYDIGAFKKMNFFNWSDCVEDFDETQNRLHAKIYHFQYEEEQFMLLGSPNASWQAFGVNNKNPINAEAAILFHSTSKISLLRELGIKIPKKTKAIQSLEKTEQPTIVLGSKDIDKLHATKILYAEMNNSKLTVYLKNKIDQDFDLETYDTDGFPIEKRTLKQGNSEYTVTLNQLEDLHKIVLVNTKKQVVSNFMLVHYVFLQKKCNPDQRQQRLDELIQKGKVIGGELEELLSYVTFTDDDEKSKTRRAGGVQGEGRSTEGDSAEEVIITAEDLADKSEELLGNQAQRKWNTANIILAEVLSELLKGVRSKTEDTDEEDFSESEEESQKDNLETGGNAIVISTNQSTQSKNESLEEALAILKYFNNLNKALSNQLIPFYQNPNLNIKKNALPKVSLNQLSNMIVSLKLWYFYNGKYYEEKEDETSILYPYFTSGELHDEVISSKDFISTFVSSFLLLATHFEDYNENPYYSEKLSVYRKEATELIIFGILNTYWREKEQVYKKIMLLDTLKLINVELVDNAFIQSLEKKINLLEKDAKLISNQFNSNKMNFFNQLAPKFAVWQKTFNDTTQRKKLFKNTDKGLYKGAIIYKGQLGFCKYQKCIGQQIHLSKVSFLWNAKIIKRQRKPDKIEWFYNDELTYKSFSKWKTSILFE